MQLLYEFEFSNVSIFGLLNVWNVQIIQMFESWNCLWLTFKCLNVWKSKDEMLKSLKVLIFEMFECLNGWLLECMYTFKVEILECVDFFRYLNFEMFQSLNISMYAIFEKFHFYCLTPWLLECVNMFCVLHLGMY